MRQRRHPRPVDILSAKEVIRYLVNHVPFSVYNLPSNSRQVQEAEEDA